TYLLIYLLSLPTPPPKTKGSKGKSAPSYKPYQLKARILPINYCSHTSTSIGARKSYQGDHKGCHRDFLIVSQTTPADTSGKQGRYTSDENALLVRLKEREGMPWAEVAVYFP
ncbi:hypothetical protein GB937_009556, partial [Aspergillus fischeri]